MPRRTREVVDVVDSAILRYLSLFFQIVETVVLGTPIADPMALWPVPASHLLIISSFSLKGRKLCFLALGLEVTCRGMVETARRQEVEQGESEGKRLTLPAGARFV